MGIGNPNYTLLMIVITILPHTYSNPHNIPTVTVNHSIFTPNKLTLTNMRYWRNVLSYVTSVRIIIFPPYQREVFSASHVYWEERPLIRHQYIIIFPPYQREVSSASHVYWEERPLIRYRYIIILPPYQREVFSASAHVYWEERPLTRY